MRERISLSFSPCPNDIFLFYGIISQRVDTFPFDFDICYQDIASLNQGALRKDAQLTKVSALTWGAVRSFYDLLPVGAAFGKQTGPLLIQAAPVGSSSGENPETGSKELDLQKIEPRQIEVDDVVLLPGKGTTAELLFRHQYPDHSQVAYRRFEAIPHLVARGEFSAGVLIHETRFSLPEKGLYVAEDLGRAWIEHHKMPLPLGVLCLPHFFTPEQKQRLSEIIRSSLTLAWAEEESARELVLKHSQEKDTTVAFQHIETYLHEMADAMGETGVNAIETLLADAQSLGLIPELP